MSRILALGASGQIGRFLLPRLRQDSHNVWAISRSPALQKSSSNLIWLQGDLCEAMPTLPDVEVVMSLGPLDAFVQWFKGASLPYLQRVIAISSMSVLSKEHSIDPEERVLAARLAASEQLLIESCNERNYSWTIFRPTLIYGAGLDRSLTPLARFAQRYRVLPIPLGASGLRQPVHADDLAWACVSVRNNPRTWNRIYPLGGGEQLRFDSMLRRLCISLPKRVLLIPLPQWFLRLALRLLAQQFSVATFSRLSKDLIAINDDAEHDFGFTPRGFTP